MADILITTDFSQLTNLNNALNQTAITVERKTNPALQRLQENLQFVKRVNEQVAQSNQMVGRSFSLNELNRASERLQNYEAALANTRQGMNSFGVVTQQAGYQIGDFLVQVQSGTNWMVAFGQQATQLVGILPMMGAGFMGLSTGALVALSAGLGIAIPLVTAIGAAYMRMSESADSAANSVMTLAEAQEQLNQVSSDYALKLEMLRFGVDTQSEAIALKEIYDLTAQIQRLNREYQQTDSLSRRQAIAEEVLGLKEQLSIQQRIVDEVNSKRQAYETAVAINEQMLAIELGHARAAGQTAAAAKQIEFTNAASSAAQLAEQLGISVAHASSLLAMGFGGDGVVFDPRDPNYNSIKAEMERIKGNYGTVSPFDPSRQAKLRSPSGGGSSAAAEQEDALQRLREQLALENELLGVSEAQQRVIRALGNDRANYTQAEIAAITAEIEAYNQKLEVMKQQQQIANVIQSSMEDAFMGIITGTESVKDAFKNMAYLIIQELYRVLVVQRLVGSFTAGGGGILGAAFSGLGAGLMGGAGAATVNGFALTGGMRASGGSMMAGKSYLVGERGPELVIPRHSSTVVNANQTSGAMAGGGDITVQNNISVTGSDAAMVRAEVAKMIPQITNATKAAVIDAKQRGGQMAAAFR